ncbi:hypothetical protein MA16_Dca021678 [Dendrobium catenatum]|uniref:Uncharacterized protein n=1 Tax=Dendrobium catenatum TaxID=906689 RepID=A0A2I0V773_9ASPA|nr:hypothetical protein MA16_Dca021678 [Dendrobium catenatum]
MLRVRWFAPQDAPQVRAVRATAHRPVATGAQRFGLRGASTFGTLRDPDLSLRDLGCFGWHTNIELGFNRAKRATDSGRDFRLDVTQQIPKHFTLAISRDRIANFPVVLCYAGTLAMQISTTIRHSAPCIVVLFFICLPNLSSADEIVVDSHPSLLRLSPGRPVENSPGTRTGAVVTCNRVHLRGLSRIRDIDKFFHALRITASVSQGDGLFRIQTVELCFHRNASLGIGMCPAGHWRKVTNKGSFVRSLSPFEDWILDVRVLPDPSRVVEVTSELGELLGQFLFVFILFLEERTDFGTVYLYGVAEFLPHRVVFLVLGFSIMLMADYLSESITFYYGSAMTIGIILVILMVLYQVRLH